VLAQNFVLPAMLSRERAIERIATVLSKLAIDRAWRVSVVEHKPKRSDSQNRYLWAIYGEILSYGGPLSDFEKDELHDFFLGKHFGVNRKTVMGVTMERPLRRSSSLNKKEFGEFVEFIQRFMANQGVYIRDPYEETAV
jgi:hypothetical protein